MVIFPSDSSGVMCGFQSSMPIGLCHPPPLRSPEPRGGRDVPQNGALPTTEPQDDRKLKIVNDINLHQQRQRFFILVAPGIVYRSYEVPVVIDLFYTRRESTVPHIGDRVYVEKFQASIKVLLLYDCT